MTDKATKRLLKSASKLCDVEVSPLRFFAMAKLIEAPCGLPWEDHLDGRYNLGYTFSMKTAISIPDRIFEVAERTARRLGMSRSELYANAVEEFLKTRSGAGVTEKLNKLYAEKSTPLEPFLSRLQSASLAPDDW